MSNSPLAKNSNNQDQPDIQFTTGNIGRWASQQEDPFAEQNRQRATKKQQRNAKRQKAAPIVVITTGVILTAAAVVGLVFLITALVKRDENTIPVIDNDTLATSADYYEILQNFYNKNGGNVEAIDEAVENQTLSSKTEKEKALTNLAAIAFYMTNGYYEKAIDLEEAINVEDLEPEEIERFYAYMIVLYGNIGNKEKVAEYSELRYDISLVIGGYGG